MAWVMSATESIPSQSSRDLSLFPRKQANNTTELMFLLSHKVKFGLHSGPAVFRTHGLWLSVDQLSHLGLVKPTVVSCAVWSWCNIATWFFSSSQQTARVGFPNEFSQNKESQVVMGWSLSNLLQNPWRRPTFGQGPIWSFDTRWKSPSQNDCTQGA